MLQAEVQHESVSFKVISVTAQQPIHGEEMVFLHFFFVIDVISVTFTVLTTTGDFMS